MRKPRRPWDGGSLLVLRREAARFFGKTSKVSLIVTFLQPASLPRPHRLRPFWAAALVLVTLATLAGRLVAQEPAAGRATVYGRTPQPGGPATVVEPSGQGERIVATALAGLARAESMSARVRQRVRVGDRVVVGAGRYVQLGSGIDQRFRYEMSMQTDTETFEILEVCDGIFSWSFKRLGPNPPQLERLDVRRVREKLERLKVLEQLGASPYLGGIQRSLALTRQWFRFAGVESAAIDEVAVWSVTGTWHADSLAALLPEQAEAIRAAGGLDPPLLPDGMPWSVRLSIGKRELFPFRIEWLAIPGPRPVADAPLEPIAVMELYDVQIDGPVDASAFVYRPAIEGLIDITDGYVKHLGPLRP
ncbi:MAG: hypothetical protein O3A37_05365 [Planctomycetota bacterium]|nr:hypothetical protein [Planctomycetota bacterium]